MFNVVLLVFAAARWSPSLARAASLGVLAAATPVLVALACFGELRFGRP
jgi:hypothetical protein